MTPKSLTTAIFYITLITLVILVESLVRLGWWGDLIATGAFVTGVVVTLKLLSGGNHGSDE